ncbi:peptide/nickel transport system permease protein [Bosea sp. OK403]|uniref:ABC transporter permease n=1 Tax=Bosea sp. OK403 TaxID=1855286 RepID=UPI0008E61203|nr:ABC transporter permease [Bosea sp. OK403]SFJ02638.1 peptide/nickel transport system permease protein [Bosea sp. OK403]
MADLTTQAAPVTVQRSWLSPIWRRILGDKLALVAAIILLVIVLAALFAPWLAPFDPYETTRRPFIPPRWSEGSLPQYWLGTDGQGRDMLSRLLYGTRLTLVMGLASIVLGGGLGAMLGLLGAFYRRLDPYVMRSADILLSFPAILLGLALAAVVGPGLTAIVIALSIATVPDVARITRSAAIVVMGQDYMEAGRALGLPDRTLIWRYLALNCISPVFVFMTLRFGQIILIGAALSFLGLGVRPPEAELGMMASLGRDALFFAPHISLLPSLTIIAIVLCVNLLGDALRDLLDPRMRNM